MAHVNQEPLTESQRIALRENPHLVVLDRLSDGALLVGDKEVALDGSRLGPYILTKDGGVSDIYLYFEKYHGIRLPRWSAEETFRALREASQVGE